MKDGRGEGMTQRKKGEGRANKEEKTRGKRKIETERMIGDGERRK